ncbi:MAG: L,D-transpeptidase [Bacteroidia bacterium]
MKQAAKVLFLLVCVLSACVNKQPENTRPAPVRDTAVGDTLAAKAEVKKQVYTLPFPADVKVKDYFKTVDSIVDFYCQTIGHNLTEHVLINANPRIIDTLASFDYYLNMQDSIFIYDQKELVVFHRGDSLLIPDSSQTRAIEQKLKSIVIDVNIPEYRLRIIEGTDTVYTFRVRVGANKQKYLETAGRIVNLKTKTGVGEIVRLERNPYYLNPATGKRYYGTNRDDQRYTMMPLIPWIEPSLNGIRHGDLIHPTTNPETLGKPYSHGCIGLNESDAWRVYYSAPLGTKVIFRYDLKVPVRGGDTIVLEDIYGDTTTP